MPFWNGEAGVRTLPAGVYQLEACTHPETGKPAYCIPDTEFVAHVEHYWSRVLEQHQIIKP